MPREGWAERQGYELAWARYQNEQWQNFVEGRPVADGGYRGIALWAARKLKGKIKPEEADEFMEVFMTELGFDVVAHVQCKKTGNGKGPCILGVGHEMPHYNPRSGTWQP